MNDGRVTTDAKSRATHQIDAKTSVAKMNDVLCSDHRPEKMNILLYRVKATSATSMLTTT